MIPKATKGLSLGARFVFGMLVTRANGENECWPGQIAIAEEMGVNVRTVQRILDELVLIGMIQVVRTGKCKTNMYRIVGNYFATQPVEKVSTESDTTNCRITPEEEKEASDTTPVSSTDTTPMSHPYMNKNSTKRTVSPLPPQVGGLARSKKLNPRAMGTNPRALNPNYKPAQAKKKPYIDGDPAFHDDATDSWRVKIHTGEWKEYAGNVKEKLEWR